MPRKGTRPRKRPRGSLACRTCKPIKLEYLAGHADAERRLAAGERQRQCPECKLWRWPDELPERTP